MINDKVDNDGTKKLPADKHDNHMMAIKMMAKITVITIITMMMTLATWQTGLDFTVTGIAWLLGLR